MKILDPRRLQAAEQVRQAYQVVPETGTALDEILAPEYWRNYTNRLHHGDRIEVFAEDFSFIADLVVTDIGKTWVTVLPHHVSRHESPTAAAEAKRDAGRAQYSVRMVTGKGYGVFSASGGEALCTFPSEFDARQWIERAIA